MGRRHVLRSGAAAVTLLGTATPATGRVNSASASGKSGVDDFAPSTTDWTRQQKLAVDDGDSFGNRVALSSDGTTALIGDHTNQDPNGEEAGAAYVFTRTDGEWSHQEKLTPNDGDDRDRFGNSVALSGDGTTALIGSFRDEDPNGDDAGSVYVFTRSDDEWSQQRKLTPDDGDDEDRFGLSVALSDDGTTALIGAKWDDNPNGGAGGSAYVFTLAGGEWSYQQKLAAVDGDVNDEFGASVALSGDGTTALIGANNDEDPIAYGAGSAYIFTLANGEWNQQQKLTANDGTIGAGFGSVVSLSSNGTTALIGADNGEGPNGYRGGSAYVFTQAGGEWSQQQKLTPDDGDGADSFACSVTLSSDGTTALIGAKFDEDPNGDQAGSAYVFTHTDGEWSQQQKLAANDGDDRDFFGVSGALSGDGTTAFIGADNDEDPHNDGGKIQPGAGSTYVFTESSTDDGSDEDGSGDDGSDDTNNLSRFDTNNNGEIDFNEVIDAIAANNSGTEIGGEPVSFNDVLAVIEAHNTDTQM